MRRLPVVAGALLLLAACSSTSGHGSVVPGSSSARSTPRSTRPVPTSSSKTRPTTSPARTSSPPAPATAEGVLAGMSLRERVGQLLMVDCPTTSVPDATVVAIRQSHVGSVILDGTSTAGMGSTQDVTGRLRALAPRGVGLFIATDQEGGLVQRLQGPGFTRIVSAVEQGGIAPATLQEFALSWAQQLRQAGVNVNLAPVLDTVPAGFGSNPPIGDLDRQYGSTPAAVTAHGMAVVRGMTAAGIDVTVKHFPGLGRTRGNTDLSSGVTDYVTTRDDPYLAPFRAAIAAHVPFVMMSTAIYARLDPGTPAAFSPTIVTGLLRHQLGFGGLVISDDLGNAAQVRGLSVGRRAVQFVAAGGDVVLTVDATQAATMTGALVARAQSDPTFRQQVDAAALLVLQAKQARGLLG
ncbi:MAG TPA: glycoside hydrolase family 3 N-terminal domain-containing protein [Jatrophihabitans sp.]|jgi:beta-N-acetylhexosaminidase|uniref:glycoside hydrolase family 3 N-terminal domain-containing protein n=1 Tax=Jatrophihabitans sp. TaxID=1932789 RepID=UPI002E0021EB|nr:glycoside hydrolase family 3 N-terminal domain-containing protein [Jatrophihabitans sp.]